MKWNRYQWWHLVTYTLAATLIVFACCSAQTRNHDQLCIYGVAVKESTHRVVVTWKPHPCDSDSTWITTVRVKASPNQRCIIWVNSAPGALRPEVYGEGCEYPGVIS